MPDGSVRDVVLEAATMKHNVPPKVVKAIGTLLDCGIATQTGILLEKNIRRQAKVIGAWLAGVEKEKAARAQELKDQR